MLTDAHIKHFWPEADPEDIHFEWNNITYKVKKEREALAKRPNIVTKSDCTVLMKYATELCKELLEYARRGYDDNFVFGDSHIIMRLIELQNRTIAIRAKEI